MELPELKAALSVAIFRDEKGIFQINPTTYHECRYVSLRETYKTGLYGFFEVGSKRFYHIDYIRDLLVNQTSKAKIVNKINP